MRLYIIAILALTILYQSTSGFWVLTSFYVNQDYIADNLCVNRFDAIPVCNGKCYVASELQKDADKEQQLPAFNEKPTQPLFINENDFHFTPIAFSALSKRKAIPYLSNLFDSDTFRNVFEPPETSVHYS